MSANKLYLFNLHKIPDLLFYHLLTINLIIQKNRSAFVRLFLPYDHKIILKLCLL